MSREASRAAPVFLTRLHARYDREREAKNLAMLTGWDLATIRARMAATGVGPIAVNEAKWWEKLGWGK